MAGSVSRGPSRPVTKRGSNGSTSASMNATMSPEATASPAHIASPLPCIGGRPRVMSSWDTTSAPAARAAAAVQSADRESTTMISSTRGTAWIRALRIAVAIVPTVASSSRAGMTTLTVVWPLACSSRSGGQSCALLVRKVDHASTTGDMPVQLIRILRRDRHVSGDLGEGSYCPQDLGHNAGRQANVHGEESEAHGYLP